MHLPSRTSLRRLAATTALVVFGLTAGASAAAADTTVSEGGMTLTVSQSENLPLTGGTITVSGSGYDEAKGIYVAVCVDNGPGQQPTPCIGGADMSGEGGGSGWISSNPPEYATGLTTPFGPGGSFELTMTLNAVDPIGGTDCTQVQCAVVTRADHTRTQDRSLDVKIPLTFSASGAIDAPADPVDSAAPTESAAPVDSSSVAVPSVAVSSQEPASSSEVESTPSEESTTEASSSADVTSESSSSSSEPMMSIMNTQEVAVDETAAEPESSGAWIWWVVGGVVVVAAVGGFVLARQRGKQKAAGHE